LDFGWNRFPSELPLVLKRGLAQRVIRGRMPRVADLTALLIEPEDENALGSLVVDDN
jgi:hypothetical protein